MSHHTIRFRRGWTLVDAHGIDSAGPITLPSDAMGTLPGPIVLTRFFRPPPLEPYRESLWLELGSVPGLVSLTLNGEPLARPGTEAGVESIPLERLNPTGNRLSLRADPCLIPNGEWGHVALSIRPREPDKGDAEPTA